MASTELVARIEECRRQRHEWKTELAEWRRLEDTARKHVRWLLWSLDKLSEGCVEAGDGKAAED